MSLAAGIEKGMAGAMAFGQQQTQNKLAKAKFEEQKRQYDQSYDESVRQFNLTNTLNQNQDKRLQETQDQDTNKYNREIKQQDADYHYSILDMGGYIAADRKSLNWQKIKKGVEEGDGQAEQLVLGYATQFGNLPEGSVAESIRALPEGGFAVSVRNADGSSGVITEDGTSNPDSTVVNFAPGQLAKLANTYFQREVASRTSKFNSTANQTAQDMIATDFALQAVNDQEADFLQNAEYERQVAAAALQKGGTALARGVDIAIADGGPEVVDMIGKDLGVARPQPTVTANPAQVDDSAPAQTDTQAPAMPTQAPAAPAPWSMDSVDRGTKSGKLIASLEGVAKDRTANPRSRKDITPAGQTEKLMARKAELEKNISAVEKNRANTPNLKVAPERDGLPKSKAELAQINAYLDKDKPNLFAQEPATEAIATQTAGKTTKEIAQGVNDGAITVDPQTINLVAQKLRDEGFKEIRDLKRLTARDAAIARAAILATSKDPNIRDEMVRQITNIFDNPDNSPNLNAKDMLNQQNSDRTYRLARANYNKSVNDALARDWETANEASAALIETTSKLFFGENGDEQNFNATSANMLFKGPALNGFFVRMKRAGTQAEKNQYMLGLNSAISLGIAGLAGEQDGGISESLADFFVRGEVTDNNNPIDFDLRRVRANDIKNPTMFYYVDADGNKTDQRIDAQELQGISESVYEIVREQAIANTPKPKGK